LKNVGETEESVLEGYVERVSLSSPARGDGIQKMIRILQWSVHMKTHLQLNPHGSKKQVEEH
jgi:hypothetical protein